MTSSLCHWRLWLVALLLCLASTLSLAAKQDVRVLRVAAASDLRQVAPKWIRAFVEEHPNIKVEVIYGSSGKLARQIVEGAPFDLFFSADERYALDLESHGHAATSPVRYAKGRLVLWWPRQTNISWTALAYDDVRHIAIAHPDHAPYGHRAMQAIQHQVQLPPTLLVPKLVRGENVAQAMQYAASGAADAAIIARALMTEAAGGKFALVDENLHEPLWQSVIVTQQAADPALAQQFLAVVFAPAGRRILERFGFGLP